MSSPKESAGFTIDIWNGCHRDGWKGLITDASFSHPAKFSRGLIRRIYEHARDERWICQDCMVIDPFGGIALGAFDAMQFGLSWIGIELEEKFVNLGRENIAEWQYRYGHRPGYGSARLIQGDSRKLSEGLREAGLCVSSPPYADFGQSQGTDNKRAEFFSSEKQATSANAWREGYGTTPGNLGSLKADDKGFEASLIVASPPYNENKSNTLHGQSKGVHTYDENESKSRMKRDYLMPENKASLGALPMTEAGLNLAISSPPFSPDQPCSSQTKAFKDYEAQKHGTKRDQVMLTDGNLQAMKEGDFSLVVSSPPYHESLASDDPEKRGGLFRDEKRKNDKSLTATYGESEGNLGNMKAGDLSMAISSPPYAGSDLGGSDGQRKMSGSYTPEENKATKGGKGLHGSYGKESEGQLGAMKESSEGFSLAVSSPPYSERRVHGQNGIDWDKTKRRVPGRGGEHPTPGRSITDGYGAGTDGQLGAMRDKGFDLSVSSPPWEAGAEGAVRGTKFKDSTAFAKGMAERSKNGAHGHPSTEPARITQLERDSQKVYGNREGQLGKDSGQDFWTAARQIVEETYKVLAPGAHAIWVIKGFVRKGKYVDFPDQWRQLCEAVGFETLHWHEASLVERSGVQRTFDGHEDEIKVERKSFFRRIAELKGSPEINAEIVLCMSKPE